MPKFRTVEIDLMHLAGDSYAGSQVRFKLREFGVTPEAIFPGTEKKVKLDAQGRAEVSLWVNGESDKAALYEAILPSRETFLFVLEAGESPVTLSQLQQTGAAEGTPQYETIKSFLLANPEQFEGPAGPPGQVMSYRITAGETREINDGQVLTLPIIDIRAGGTLKLEAGGILDNR